MQSRPADLRHGIAESTVTKTYSNMKARPGFASAGSFVLASKPLHLHVFMAAGSKRNYRT